MEVNHGYTKNQGVMWSSAVFSVGGEDGNTTVQEEIIIPTSYMPPTQKVSPIPNRPLSLCCPICIQSTQRETSGGFTVS